MEDHSFLMRVGIVRTCGSVCRCAESIADALTLLGHEAILADSEEIEFRADDLVRRCDLIFDHTDTFKGRGFLRAMVRLLLESRGGCIVGSDAKASFIADDKIAAKTKLSAAGIPTPPGIVVTSREWELPQWLQPPFVLKPAFEHMSRGLVLVQNESEVFRQTTELLHRFTQPVLIESYVPGRELSVPLLIGPTGIEVLPIVEWRLNTGDVLLSETFKQVDPSADSIMPADLSLHVQSQIEDLARRAFEVLGLRDYARFDLRLTQNGTPFFLEANVTPSLETGEAFARAANWAGLPFPMLIERILQSARIRYVSSPEKNRKIAIELPTGVVNLVIPEGVHHPPPSSIELAKLLDVVQGETVLDLGCGSGILSIAAARLGAKQVLSVDIDPTALDATADNAERNGVREKIKLLAGSWLEPLKQESSIEKFDVIIATPPQTPGTRPFGQRYGGQDGTDHLFSILDEAASFLAPQRGRLWLLAISLANPIGVWKRLEKMYSKVSLVHETRRSFTREEYESMNQGLFGHLLDLRSSGRSQFDQDSDGKWFFRNLFIRAGGLRNP